MSDRQPGSAKPSRLSSANARAVRVRMLSTGRWRTPLGPTAITGRRAPRVIAVGAATAGVGKSLVASNLAVAIGGLGRQVVLVDLDLEAPRQHALFGVPTAPSAERPTGVRNVRLWPADAAIADAQDSEPRAAAIEALGGLDADVVIVDLAEGRRDDLWRHFSGAERLLVTTGARPALEATYAFLHQAKARATERHGADAKEVLAQFAGGLVGNLTETPEEAELFHAFARLVREELGIPLTALGSLRRSARLARSTTGGKPLCALGGIDDEVRVFHQLAEQVMTERGAPPDCPLDGASGAPDPVAFPADFGRYQRRHPRFAVDWAATLEVEGEPNAVRVRDVSESGAGIETTVPLRVGDRAVLHFYQLDDALSVEVVVKNVVGGLSRVGLGFVARGTAAARIAAAARARLGEP
ncbi:MAG TPA: PilZ domain-containing protein [Polyangia bacterium]|nr:PilZ domain-containing protein [Polyangia bacterium]